MIVEKRNKYVPFFGAAAAVVTPFSDGKVDLESLGCVIDHLSDGGIGAVAVCGTTGEAPALTVEEYREIVRFSCERVRGRIPVIAGAGGSTTERAARLSEIAGECGAAAVLSVTPYYNKASHEGLYRHYSEIARAGLPVILYNVPSRTGVNIEPATYEILADHENITAIKEANGNISKIVDTMARVHGKLDLYSGNDDQIVPLMALGGIGCISVLSNILPAETSELCRKFLDGDVAGSAAMQYRFHDLIDALFSEVNPIPVKAAMAKMGFCSNTLRLPLTPMEEAGAEHLYKLMRREGINV